MSEENVEIVRAAGDALERHGIHLKICAPAQACGAPLRSTSIRGVFLKHGGQD